MTTSCGYDSNKKTGRVLYLFTAAALLLHLLGHIAPIVFFFVDPAIREKIVESPILTWTALLFIPLSLYHLYRDRKIHSELHRLQEIEWKYNSRGYNLEYEDEDFPALTKGPGQGKIRKQELKDTLRCSICPPHKGENSERKPKHTNWKQSRKDRFNKT